MVKKVGKYTYYMEEKPAILSFASVVGPKEAQGPLAKYFDKVYGDSFLGEKTWEKAESKLQSDAVNIALNKSGKDTEEIDFIFAGDLLNQCISSTFGMLNFNIPYLCQYGACSTMAQNIALSSIMVESNVANNCIAVTSSHFCSAERQFRFPMDYGGQRTPTSQRTVTGSGAVIIGKSDVGPKIATVSIGKIVDMGIKDMNNMGAAMAPAAAETIKHFFRDTMTEPKEYDAIFTGDLGKYGSELLYEILYQEKLNIRPQHNDCGLMIFDKTQDAHAGGSGCGCSASVLCSVILDKMQKEKLKNILFIATGALMSTTSSQQGNSIPGIAHLIHITV